MENHRLCCFWKILPGFFICYYSSLDSPDACGTVTVLGWKVRHSFYQTNLFEFKQFVALLLVTIIILSLTVN